jgi:hypothetical protein
MSDVYQPEVNPDQEPGESLQEGLRGADAGEDGDVDENGNVAEDDPDL